jgi:Protein of unknown function (DUF3558)
VRRIVVGIALLVAAGCTAPAAGVPAPGSAAPSTIALPPRPREVSTLGVDPCALLTPAQRAQLGLEQPPVFTTAKSELYNGGEEPGCSTRGNEPRAISVAVFLPTGGGVEVFTSGRLAAAVTPTAVQGFPAVRAIPDRFTDYCSVVVDVADHLALDIQFRDGGRKPPVPQDQLCAGAQEAADLAMATLLKLR